MRVISVSYHLSDEDEQRLEKITEEYKKQGLDLTSDKMFESMMCCGGTYDIDSKFRFHEWKLGLRKDII